MPLIVRFLLAILAVVVLGTVGFVLTTHARFSAYARHKQQPPPPGNRIVEAWDEITSLLVMLTWHLRAPFVHRLRGPVSEQPIVLCVHGFTQNGSNFERLRRHLHAEGRATDAVFLGFPPRSIERYADALEAHLLRHARLDVVCHSMGGIVLRRVLARSPELADRIVRVVTIATPHAGTAAARGVRLPDVEPMKRRSPALQTLPHLADLAPHAAITSIGGTADHTVYPTETTVAPGGIHVEVPGLGHAGVLVRWSSLSHVLAALRRSPPPRPDPRATLSNAEE